MINLKELALKQMVEESQEIQCRLNGTSPIDHDAMMDRMIELSNLLSSFIEFYAERALEVQP